MIENLVRQDQWNAMKDWAVPQSKLSANKELHNCVSNVVYRQTNVLTWDVLTLGRFDLGRFDSGTFWLWDALTWDVLTWDVLTLGRFDLGHFDFGTCWLGTFFAISSLIKYSENILGTFWLTKNGTFWQITWDVLVLGRFDRIPSVLGWLLYTIYLVTYLGKLVCPTICMQMAPSCTLHLISLTHHSKLNL